MKKSNCFCYRILPIALCAAMLGGCGASAASSSAMESAVFTDSAPLKVMVSFYQMYDSSMPDSITEMLSGPMKLVMSLMGGSGKPKAGCEIKTQYCTAIPIGTALAQSFDPAFVNLFMPGNEGDYDNLLQGIDSGAVTLEQVKINASRVVRTVRALTQE